MLTRTRINEKAFARFCKEWRICAKEGPLPVGQVAEADRCPPECLIGEVLALAAESHGRPVDELELAIRTMVEDCRFHGESGDRVVDEHYQASIDREVQLILAALRRVKAQGMQSESCCSSAVMPYVPPTFQRIAV